MKEIATPVHQWAESQLLPVFTPSKLDVLSLEQFQSLRPDIAVLFAYGKIIPALNCTAFDNSNKPDLLNCEQAKAITEDRHPDVIEIDAASNNKTDDIRDLIEKVRIPPQIGRYKVYIIDEAHMLLKSTVSHTQ